jgi:hypothetical protein
MLNLFVLAAGLMLGASSGDLNCDGPADAGRILDDAGARTVLLGETHGYREKPAFAGEMVCLALQRGESVLLGLEMSAREQARLDAYLESDGGDAARTALLDGSSFWDSQIRDGRSSQAVFALIDRVRQWRQAGADVSLAALDHDPELDGDLDLHAYPRDHAMLRRARALGGSADRFFILIGNVHARLTPYVHGEQHIDTIGSLAEPGEFLSVNMLMGPGESWSCRGTVEDYRCGVHENGGLNLGGEPRLLTQDAVADMGLSEVFGGAYTHYVFLGDGHASWPMVPLDEELD